MALPDILKNTLRVPVVGSPLFIVSGPELVIAQCKAGIVGSFPALNARPAELLDVWLTQINEELAAYKVPGCFVFTTVPRTLTGKIQKFLLREQAKAFATEPAP